MTSLAPAAVYEVSVIGEVGPAVAAALEQWGAPGPGRAQTILRVRPGNGSDLVALVLRLESHGYDVTEISVTA